MRATIMLRLVTRLKPPPNTFCSPISKGIASMLAIFTHRLRSVASGDYRSPESGVIRFLEDAAHTGLCRWRVERKIAPARRISRPD
jgi:hypothetical protein